MKTENTNIIIRIKEKLVNFRVNYRNASSKAKDALNIAKQRELQNKLDKEYLTKDIKKKKLKLRLDNSVRFKAIIYLLLSLGSTVCSIALSVLGITNMSNFTELLENSQLLSYAALICLLQLAVWLVSFNNNYIRDRFNSHYGSLQILQKMLIGISMIGNFLFLSRLIDSKTIFDYIFVTVSAVSLDIVSNKFSSLSQDCFYLNYSYNDKKDDIEDVNGNFAKMFLFIITYKIRLWIKTQYIERTNSYKNKIMELQNKYNNVNTTVVEQPIENNVNEIVTNDVVAPTIVNNNAPNDDFNYDDIKDRLLNMHKGDVVSPRCFNLSNKGWRNLKKRLLHDELIIINGKRSEVA